MLVTAPTPFLHAQTGKPLVLQNDRLTLRWTQTAAGWRLTTVTHRQGGKEISLPNPVGEYTLLYAAEKPSEESVETFRDNTGAEFPGAAYPYQREQWQQNTTAVALNTAGTAYRFLSNTALASRNRMRFTRQTDVATVRAEWRLDPAHPGDVVITQTLVAKKSGYFSLATPTIAPVAETELLWATIPGYFQGRAVQKDFVRAYAYGHGVPARPVVYRERCASTLSPIITTKRGLTLSVIADPTLSRDPWAADRITHEDWRLGLSHRNRQGQLSPTLYYPVLGEPESRLAAGDSIRYTVRFSLTDGDWFAALNHAVYDVFKLNETLALRQNRQSLTSRVERMHHYLLDPKTSLWNEEEYTGLRIGAQSYLGGVVGSQKDAMKNADYGAMWLLATATGDSALTRNVLPYALNFKLAQQETGDPFFSGAVQGQYYLAKRKRFVEEWGDIVEPIALTYYTMLDMGNLLLFEPKNARLRERLRLGADRLLTWQRPDGSWEVAYDKASRQPLFRDVPDVRPTFYGLLVAYRILKDEKYLRAARRGADWFLANAVEPGHFLGVCGDARYAPDFATGQSAQALLDLYDLTGDSRYRTGAITCAKLYTLSIYTHPIPNRAPKTVKGIRREDWEIAQAGLSFEHGGIFGSANRHGPIQLASHAGLFIRMNRLTGERLFADLARAAAWGRHAFVDSTTSVASYYWNAMNRGAGPYPHHAWWQIGWITDYLMAEAELRSGGQVQFPRGFVTPKVGPHQTYGFAPGTVYGQPASLILRDGLAVSDNPNVEVITALSPDRKRLFVVLLNNRAQATTTTVNLRPALIAPGNVTITRKPNAQPLKQPTAELPPFGIDVWEVAWP